MNKLLATAAILATFAVSSTAEAAPAKDGFPYWYIGLGAGVTMQSDSDVEGSSTDIEWDEGALFSASLGYQPPSLGGLRLEAEYTYRNQEISNGGDDLRVNVAAANVYYDFRNTSSITPYIGGGLGYGWFDLGDAPGLGDGGDSERVIYQGMAGIGYEPQGLQNVGLTLGYRYMAPFEDLRAHNSDYEFDNHSVEVGAKFRF